jgi:hypothetical protein
MLLLCICGHSKGGVVEMWPTLRVACALWYKQKNHPLTEDEETEFRHSMDAIMRKAHRLSDLENLSLIASYSNDTDYQHEICRKIQEIQCEMADMPH